MNNKTFRRNAAVSPTLLPSGSPPPATRILTVGPPATAVLLDTLADAVKGTSLLQHTSLDSASLFGWTWGCDGGHWASGEQW